MEREVEGGKEPLAGGRTQGKLRGSVARISEASPLRAANRAMRRILFLCLIFVLAGGLVVACRPAEPEFYLGGIQVNEPDHAVWVKTLAASGMNTVEVTVYAHQGDWDSANLWYSEEEPWVVHEIRAARQQGLHVVLVLRVALDHAFERNKFFWHGMIMPRTDDEVGEWFRRYTDFVGQWARLAEAEGVDVLAVASEMNALTNTIPVDELPVLEEYWSNAEKVERENAGILRLAGSVAERHLFVRGDADYDSPRRFLEDQSIAHRRWARRVAWLDEEDPVGLINARRRLLEAQWVELIARVRRLYGGQLTYAANFDQYEFVGFWDRLDLLGINAYFPLTRRLLPEQPETDREALFQARWRSLLRSLDAFRMAQKIPGHRVLFTEIGYVGRANSTIEPWAATGFSVLPSAEGPQLVVWEEQPPDPAERALAIRALAGAHRELGGKLLAGLLYWKLSTVAAHREVEPFVLILGQEPADPMLEALSAIGSPSIAGGWRWRRAAGL